MKTSIQHKLAMELCKLEGGVTQVNIANMRQLLFCLKLIFERDPLLVMGVLCWKSKKHPRSSPRARSTSGKRDR